MIFLSYKSDNVNLVRSVAEAIFSSGLKVWFAEYYILLDNYSVFQKAIDVGIDSCNYSIFFTNSQWQESTHCRYERDKLVKKISPDNCIEVVINENGRYLEYFCNNHISISINGNIPSRGLIKTLLEHISSSFKVKLNTLHSFPIGQQIKLSNMGINLRTGPMEAKIIYNQSVSQSFLLPMVQFISEVPEGKIGLSLQVAMFDSVLSNISESSGSIHDDRELYRKYMDYGQDWIKTYNAGKESGSNIIMKAMGLHLFFKNHCSHFGLTYACYDNLNSEPTTIERRFVMPVEGDIFGEKAEISFVFYGNFSGAAEDQLKSFSRYSLFFEEVIESFEYKTPVGARALNNNFPVFFVKSIYMAGFLFLSGYFWINTSPVYAYITILISGILLRDLILYARLKLYKRMMWSMNTVEDNLSQSTYEQLSVTTFTQIFVNPVLLAFGMARSATVIPKRFLTAFLWLLYSALLIIKFIYPFSNLVLDYTGIAISFITGLNFGRYVSYNIITRITKVDKKNIS